MPVYYSSSTKGFYDSLIHGDNIPEDKIEISSEQRQSLLEAQTIGKVIASNAQGRPIAVDPDIPTQAEQDAYANNLIIKQIKELELNLQPRAIRDMLLNEDATRLLDLEDQIQELRAQLK